jgi:hypothetical protein
MLTAVAVAMGFSRHGAPSATTHDPAQVSGPLDCSTLSQGPHIDEIPATAEHALRRGGCTVAPSNHPTRARQL